MTKRCSEIHESVQKTIIDLCQELANSHSAIDLLDVGCWDGETTVQYGKAFKGSNLHGIELFEEQIRLAREKGLKVYEVDLEKKQWDIPDHSFDLIICNQVLEHLKQIFLPLDEIWRTLKPSGHFICSVPNLASLHNRLMLLFGKQPSSIRIFGPHVRGFSYHAFKDFLTTIRILFLKNAWAWDFIHFPQSKAAVS